MHYKNDEFYSKTRINENNHTTIVQDTVPSGSRFRQLHDLATSFICIKRMTIQPTKVVY